MILELYKSKILIGRRFHAGVMSKGSNAIVIGDKQNFFRIEN